MKKPQPKTIIFEKDQIYKSIQTKLKINSICSADENSALCLKDVEDKFINNKEGIEITAPLPPPPLTLDEIKAKLDYITNENHKQKVAELLLKYNSGASHNFDIGASNVEMDFPCPKNFNHNTKVYNLTLVDTLHLRYFIDLCIKMDIIECSPPDQQFGSPVFVTGRKDRQAPPRIIIDARQVNESIPYNVSSITMDPMQTLKSILPHVRYGTFVDIKNAFYNLRLSDKVLESGVSNIVTSFGCFRFKRAITGYAGTPSLLLHYILSNIHINKMGLQEIIELLLVWFDDLSMFSWKEESIEDHLAKLDILLSRLNRLNLKLNLDKCKFMVDLSKEKVTVLGYDIGEGKIVIPDKKRKFIAKIDRPKNLKDLQSFLGNLQYYRSLLSLTIHGHMNALYKQVRNFSWDEEAEYNFQSIKKIFLEDSLSNDAAIDCDVQLLYTDASKNAIGASLIGYKIRDLIPVNLPPFLEMPEKIKAYLNNSNEIGIIHQDEDYLSLFHKISNFLNIDKNEDFEKWKTNFSIHYTMNVELAYLLETTEDNVELDKLQKNKLFVERMNTLRAGGYPQECPFYQMFLFMSFSTFSKRKIKLTYQSCRDGKFIDQDLHRRFSQTESSEINIIHYNGIYYYIGSKEDVKINEKIYKKVDKNLDISDKEIYSLIEESMKKGTNDIKNRGKILGFFSKTVAPNVMEQTGIVYLEILAIFEGLTFFETDIKPVKTLVLTDNIACFKILKNTKIENRKSKLDWISQKILFWVGRYISFLSISTKEQLADFVSRLLPEQKQRLNFLIDNIKPVYIGKDFEIYEPTPIARDREGFENKNNQVDIQAITRGVADKAIKKYEELKKTGKAIKEKVISIMPEKTPTKKPIKVQYPTPQHIITDIISNNKEKKVINTPKKDITNQISKKIESKQLSEKTVSKNNEIIITENKTNEINDPLTPESKDKLSKKPEGKKLESNIKIPDNKLSNAGESMNKSTLSPSLENTFNNNIINYDDLNSILHSSNQPVLAKSLRSLEHRLNKKPTREEREIMRKEIIENYLDQSVKLQENSKENENEFPSHIEDEENDSIILRPNANATFERLRVFNKSTFIMLQINEGMSNDVYPFSLKYYNNKLILPFKLYGYITALTHADMIHSGIQKVYDNIKTIYYVKHKSKLFEIITAQISLCFTCLKSKANHMKLEKQTSITRANFYRNNIVTIDILEFPKRLNENKDMKLENIAGILVAMDVATQYLTLYFLPNLKQKSVEMGLANYIMIHGQVRFIWCDNGTNLKNKNNTELLRQLGARFLDSAPYKSASRGNIENRIKIVQNLIRIARAHAGSIKIKTALSTQIHIVNTMKLIGTSLSPYNLHWLSLYGFEGGITQTDDLFKPQFSFDEKSLETRFEEFQKPFKSLHDETREVIIKRQEKKIKKLNQYRYPHKIKINQFVLLKKDAQKGHVFHKNKPLFDLYVYKVRHVGKTLITIENIVSTAIARVNPTQLKVIKTELIGNYQLPPKIAKHFRLVTIDDIERFNEVSKMNKYFKRLPKET